jgi:hypothetical protein
MARPEKFDVTNAVWAENGTKDTIPTDITQTKVETGFVGGEEADRPYIDTFNLLFNRSESAIDSIIQEGPGSWYPRSANVNDMITTGLWGTETWGTTGDATNIIDSGVATSEFRDIAVYFTSDNEPRLLVLDNALLKLQIWDPRAKTLLSTSDDLSDDLDTSGTQVYEAHSMCTDGTYAYVTFSDTNATPDEHFIQAYTLADWTAHSGWPANGTQLSNTGNASGNERESRVINADADYLAVACTWEVIAANTDEAIAIVDKSDGSLTTEGAGDAPTGVSAQAIDSICSDGTDVYFTVIGGGSQYLCTCSIADATAAGAAGLGPVSLGTTTSSDICIISQEMIFVCLYASGTSVTTNIVGTIPLSGSGGANFVDLGQNTKGTPDTGDQYVLRDAWGCTFDGINVWIYGRIFDTNSKEVLIKIDAAKLSATSWNTDYQIGDICSQFFVLPANEETGTPTSSRWRTCKFDGRDIWMNVDPAASQTYSGQLARLPMALIRH